MLWTAIVSSQDRKFLDPIGNSFQFWFQNLLKSLSTQNVRWKRFRIHLISHTQSCFYSDKRSIQSCAKWLIRSFSLKKKVFSVHSTRWSCLHFLRHSALAVRCWPNACLHRSANVHSCFISRFFRLQQKNVETQAKRKTNATCHMPYCVMRRLKQTKNKI